MKCGSERFGVLLLDSHLANYSLGPLTEISPSLTIACEKSQALHFV